MSGPADSADESSEERVAALVAAANRLGEQQLDSVGDGGRRRGVFVLAALAVVVALVVGAFAVLGGGDDESVADSPTSGADDVGDPADATTIPAAEPVDSTLDDGDVVVTEPPPPETTATADSTPEAEAGGDTSDDDEPTADGSGDDAAVGDGSDAAGGTEGTDAATPDSTLAPQGDAPVVAGGADEGAGGAGGVGEVAESRAVVRNGQIFLEGAVPDEEASDRIAALAAEILGEANVINNYTIDPRASDPNLGNITVEDTINFEPDSARILASGEPLLNQGLALLTIRPSVTIVVIGHTDSLGSDGYNDMLSLARANAVKRWFVDRGVDPTRLTTEGRGEREPIADNETVEGRRLNRRIQFLLENLLVDS